jgi:hypothetical protein
MCKLLRNAKKGTEASYLHKTEGKVVKGHCFVTQQCMPSHGTPQHQHHSKTELASSQAPCPQPRSGSDFHLFGPLKNAVRGCQFVEDDKMKEVVHDCYVINQKIFFQWHQEACRLLG